MTRRIIGCALVLLVVPATLARSQQSAAFANGVILGPMATRAELEFIGAKAETRLHDRDLSDSERQLLRREAERISARLRDGDLRTGDQVRLTVRGDSSLSGTFAIGAGSQLLLPNIPPISVAGLLRVELNDYLTKQLARYLHDPRVVATALMRVAVLGEVRSPGYVRVSADLPLSDVLMLAGGPTADADLKATTVSRGNQQLLDRGHVADALATGATLDQLNLGAGDEILVGKSRRFSLNSVVQAAALLSGLALTAVTLRARR